MKLKKLSERMTHIANHVGDMSALANLVEVSPQAVSGWCRGTTKNLKLEHLYAVADKTGFNPRWIATGRGDMRLDLRLDPDEMKLLDRYRRLSDDNKKRIMGIMALELSMQSPLTDHPADAFDSEPEIAND